MNKDTGVLSIAEQLIEDMKASMKAGDSERTQTLRLLRGAIKNEEIKLGHPLSDDETRKVLQREAKQRRDSITAYNSAGRTGLAEHEQSELELIGAYLPQPLSETELGAIIDEVIAAVGTGGAPNLGQIMGAVMQRVGAGADGSTVSRMVREKLAG